MPVFLRRFLNAAVDARWWVLGVLLLVHVGVSWAGLRALGEADLTASGFGYYYLTTVTTVGYGDLSPATPAGRWFAALWLMVGGIALFTTVLGKAIASVSGAWRSRMEGGGDYSRLTGATVAIGYEAGRTERLIAELQADDGRAGGTDEAEIVVVATEAPRLPEGVRLVRTDRLSDVEALCRAGIERAGRVVIHAEDDDATLAACLGAAAAAGSAHIVAYFDDEDTAALARHHCPQVETVTSAAEELLVRAAADPGASAVLTSLVSATSTEGALYSARGADLGAPTTAGALAERLRNQRASLLALASGGAPALCFGPDDPVTPEHTVFYVAKGRVA